RARMEPPCGPNETCYLSNPASVLFGINPRETAIAVKIGDLGELHHMETINVDLRLNLPQGCGCYGLLLPVIERTRSKWIDQILLKKELRGIFQVLAVCLNQFSSGLNSARFDLGLV